MRAVITVIGKDMVGILAGVSNICVKYNVNIMEVSQSIMQDMFAMSTRTFSIRCTGYKFFNRESTTCLTPTIFLKPYT